jgi:hypothetical protein
MAAGLRSWYNHRCGLAHWFNNKLIAVILLSFVLAVGFLLIILSCALWSNWLPLLVGMCNLLLLTARSIDLTLVQR